MRNAYKIIIGRPEEKRSLGRPRRRWKENIQTDRKEIELESVDWVQVAQDRDQWRGCVVTVMYFWVPQTTGNFLVN
jgi:hypothetical protein